MATAKKPSNARQKGKAAPQPKILRIGVIQAGKIIEERLIRRRDNVTIGASPRNTIVVPASTLPRTFVLFEIQANQYKLRFSDSMDGRISVNNKVFSLESVRQKGLAQGGKAGLYVLQLDESSRGKVLLGEITLLFQFVTPPPVQPRPQLPPSIRGGFVTNIDWVLATAFVSLAVVHFGFIMYLRTLDFPKNLEADVVPDRFADYIPEVETPKVMDIKKLADMGEKKEKVAEKVEKGPAKKGGGGKKTKRGPAKVCDQACQEARAARRRAKLAAQVSRMGVLKLLGTKGKGTGATANLIGSGDPGTDMDKAFSGVGGLTTGGRGKGLGGGLRGKGGGGAGKAVGIGDLGARAGKVGSVGTGRMVKERVPKAVVKQSRPDIDGTMNADATYRILKRGMKCVKSRYQRALKRDPGLSGKISVCFTVNTQGRVSKLNVDADTINDPLLANQVKACLKRLSFPPPEGGSAEVCVPFVLQSSK